MVTIEHHKHKSGRGARASSVASSVARFAKWENFWLDYIEFFSNVDKSFSPKAL